MSIRYFNESSLATSEIFKGINDISSENQVEKAKRIIKNNEPLTKDDIETVYIQIKQYPNSLSRAALKSFEEEKVVLIYNENRELSVSKALPFITFKMTSGYKTYVFMDNYITRNKDGIINLQAPIFHDLIVGASISNSLKSNYNKLRDNQLLPPLLMNIYAKLVMRILNREYSIAADKILFDSLVYWINKFFIYRVVGIQEEEVESMLTKHFKYVDDLKYSEIKIQYDNTNPTNVSEFLELVKTISSRMKTLALGIFLSNWINYYYPPATLAIDTIEYLIFMVMSLLNGNNIVNVMASDMVKETKNIKPIREELLKLIS
jgi:hypothetical protein